MRARFDDILQLLQVQLIGCLVLFLLLHKLDDERQMLGLQSPEEFEPVARFNFLQAGVLV